MALPGLLHIHHGGKQVGGTIHPLCNFLCAPLRGFTGAHGGRQRPLQEVGVALVIIQNLLANFFCTPFDDFSIGPRATKLGGVRRGQLFNPGRNVGNLLQRYLAGGRVIVLRQALHKSVQLRLQRLQGCHHLSRRRQGLHGQHTITFHIQQTLQQSRQLLLFHAAIKDNQPDKSPGVETEGRPHHRCAPGHPAAVNHGGAKQ